MDSVTSAGAQPRDDAQKVMPAVALPTVDAGKLLRNSAMPGVLAMKLEVAADTAIVAPLTPTPADAASELSSNVQLTSTGSDDAVGVALPVGGDDPVPVVDGVLGGVPVIDAVPDAVPE